MDTLKEIVAIASHATLALPALEVTLLIVLLTVCLLLRYTRTGLVIAYLFTYRWGWLFFVDQTQDMMVGYMIFGCIVGILTVISMLRSP